MPALRVPALDPTGAGDVFGAGIVLGTLSGWPLADRVAFATLCSSLAVQQFGGSLAAPGWGDIADWWHTVRDNDQRGSYHSSLHAPLRLPRRARAHPAGRRRAPRRAPPSPGTPTSRGPVNGPPRPRRTAARWPRLSKEHAMTPRTATADGRRRHSASRRGRVRARLGQRRHGLDPHPGHGTHRRGQLGEVTLTVWDQEVRGGQAAQMRELNKAFQAKYPNITLKRVSRSFDDLKTTLRLALCGNEPPDVVEANNGRSDMGAFVKAGQLLPLDAYAKAYGWNTATPSRCASTRRTAPTARPSAQGTLYGLPQVGEVVGIFYNAEKLTEAGVQPPTTWAEFESALAASRPRARCR